MNSDEMQRFCLYPRISYLLSLLVISRSQSLKKNCEPTFLENFYLRGEKLFLHSTKPRELPSQVQSSNFINRHVVVDTIYVAYNI
jgi:hypothetical protein